MHLCQTDINPDNLTKLSLIYFVFMFDSIEEIKIMTESDSETKMYTVVSIFDRCVFPSFACFFCCFHTTTDYPRQIYRDTRHVTLYNGTVSVYPHQRTGECECQVIAAVLTLRVQKVAPADRLWSFSHTKRICDNCKTPTLRTLVKSPPL